MLPRFYAPGAEAAGTVVSLPDDEAVHLTRVLRLSPGDAVRVFDGRGREWRGEVQQVARAHASVRLVAAMPPAPEPRVDIWLAAAVLKGDKTDDVVRDAVMLGVGAFTGLITRRAEAPRRTVMSPARAGRWHRIAVASVKQCGRAKVPAIAGPLEFERWLGIRVPPDSGGATGRAAHRRVMLVEPTAQARGVTPIGELRPANPTELVVGPEGGWTPEEIAAAQQSGCMLVSLGGLTLRADAVPIVAISALRAMWGEM